MIPQNADNNRHLWEGIESSTRTMAESRDLYVITGPIFEGNSLQRINGRVFVPTSIFKAIYDPHHRQAAAYITPNAPGMAYQTVSIAELEQRIGINLFPSLPESVKRSKMPLPEPTPHGYNTQAEHVSQYGSGRHHAGYLPAGYTAYRLAKHLLR
ncbi:DNA/RNA non-specific endonuclease [Undibacterium arcticum]